MAATAATGAMPDLAGVEAVGALAPHYYFSWMCVLLVAGLPVLANATEMLYSHFHKLPPIIRPAYSLLLAWDWFLVLGYLVRDMRVVSLGHITNDGWCQMMGFVNISGVLSLRLSAAVTAYLTYRLSRDGRSPCDASTTIKLHGSAVVAGVVLASLFLIHGDYGPYKGLYCCLREDAYRPIATVPCFLVTSASILAVAYYHAKAYKNLPETTDSTTDILVRRGLVHGYAFYLLWSLIIAAGSATAMGFEVPLGLDIMAAWLVKSGPLVDGLLLAKTLAQLLHHPPFGSKF